MVRSWTLFERNLPDPRDIIILNLTVTVSRVKWAALREGPWWIGVEGGIHVVNPLETAENSEDEL